MKKNKKNNGNNVHPLVLIILDGWGVSAKKKGNPIALGYTPNYDRYLKTYPNSLLKASGRDVGLESKQDGNSEAGHLNIGAGRVVLQDIVRISRAIDDGSFFRNPAFDRAVKHVKRHNSTLHLMGLLSNNQSAHANPDHLLALLSYVQQLKLSKVVLHLFTDGRDSPRYEAIELIKKLQNVLGIAKVGSIMGRFFAMDRGHNWTRIEKAYNLLTMGEGLIAKSAEEAILQAYNRNETDEFIHPTLIVQDGGKPAIVNDQDSVIFFNLRSDRARQLTRAFVEKKFAFFNRKKEFSNLVFAGMTDFGPDFHILSAYPSMQLEDTLPMVLRAYRQLYISESEKFAHVTYFFNGGYDHTVADEDRVVIPSPSVRTYDMEPQMSTFKLFDYVKKDLKKHKHDFIVMNVAAPDMVAHTGKLTAGIKAVEAVDKALGDLEKTVLEEGAYMLITADHGNIEEMVNSKTGAVDTEHSTNLVPAILIGSKLTKDALKSKGKLSDIAPTILQLFGVPQPTAMTGKSLIKSTLKSQK